MMSDAKIREIIPAHLFYETADERLEIILEKMKKIVNGLSCANRDQISGTFQPVGPIYRSCKRFAQCDIDFQVQLIHHDLINVAYILKLMTRLKQAKTSEAAKTEEGNHETAEQRCAVAQQTGIG